MNLVEKVVQLLKKGELAEAHSHINRIKSTESAEDILILAEEVSQLGYMEEAKGIYEHCLNYILGKGN